MGAQDVTLCFLDKKGTAAASHRLQAESRSWPRRWCWLQVAGRGIAERAPRHAGEELRGWQKEDPKEAPWREGAEAVFLGLTETYSSKFLLSWGEDISESCSLSSRVTPAVSAQPSHTLTFSDNVSLPASAQSCLGQEELLCR